MEDLQAEKDLENYEPNISAEQDIEDVQQALSLKQKYESKTLIAKKTLQADRNEAEKGKHQSMVAETKDTYSKRHVPSAADNAVRLHNQLSTSLVNEVKSQMSKDTSWSELLNAVLFGVQLKFQLDRSTMFIGRSDLISAKDCIKLLKAKPINTFIDISKKLVRWRYSDMLDNPGYYDRDEECWQSKLLWKDMSSTNQGSLKILCEGQPNLEYEDATDTYGNIVLSGWVAEKATYVTSKKEKGVIKEKEKSWNQVSFQWHLKFWLSLFLPPFTAPKICAGNEEEENKKSKSYIQFPCKGLVPAFILGHAPASNADATVASNYRKNLRVYHQLLQYILWGKMEFKPPADMVIDETADADVYDESSDEDKIYKEVKRRFGLGIVSDFRERKSSLEEGGGGFRRYKMRKAK